MFFVREKTIGEAWLASISCVLEHGEEYIDEDVQIKEILGLGVDVLSPAQTDSIVEQYGDPYIVDHTLRKFQKGVVMENRPFTYGNCIYNKNGVDQFEWLVERLNAKMESKSATISLLTEGDCKSNLPCLVTLDAKIRNNLLNIQFFFRSQNILGRQYANLLAISDFQNKLADRLCVGIGRLAGYVASAHIYEYDYQVAKEIINQQNVRVRDQFYIYGPKSIRNNMDFKK